MNRGRIAFIEAELYKANAAFIHFAPDGKRSAEAWRLFKAAIGEDVTSRGSATFSIAEVQSGSEGRHFPWVFIQDPFDISPEVLEEIERVATSTIVKFGRLNGQKEIEPAVVPKCLNERCHICLECLSCDQCTCDQCTCDQCTCDY